MSFLSKLADRLMMREKFYNRKFNRNVDDWSLNDWFTGLAGEVGELGNYLKKIRRGDFTLEEKREEVEDEVGDIQAYLILFCDAADIDLEGATQRKYDKVNKRWGYDG